MHQLFISLKAQISREACQTVVLDRIYEQMSREAPIIKSIRNEISRRSATASTDSPLTDSVTTFGCFPNPTADDLSLVFKTDAEGSILVTNRFFRTLYQKEVKILEGQNEFLINGSEFPEGVIVVMLKTPKGIFYKKVVKI